ncbi:uncharacterized protein LOC134192261 [Corticium candelabrum]|uniref:uncharacterized protein LOC134192261 n=1 Tax=Corticium candelabrum TaxID=121492 RepID=UPI002E2625A1|nr:uncharacterized protein LOC134192261 [Corticium candelabrum]
MFLLSLLLVTLSLSLTVDANCCIATSYQISASGLRAQVLEIEPQFYAMENYMLAFDLKSQNGMLNLTMVNSLSGVRRVETYYFQEAKGVRKQYTVIDNRECIETPIIGPGLSPCFPSDVKVVTTFSFAGLNCLVVTYSQSYHAGSSNTSIAAATIITDKCIPIATAFLVRGINTTIGIQSQFETADLLLFYDSTELKDVSILAPPKICSHAQSVNASAIGKEELVFLQMMDGVESLDVFTVLNRLARLSPTNLVKN